MLLSACCRLAQHDRLFLHLESMRARHEEAMGEQREHAQREAALAQAHHESMLAQLRRQGEAQLEAAHEARRAEGRRADELAKKLGEVSARLHAIEADLSLSVSASASTSAWNECKTGREAITT